jgi:hypothetical protein
MVIRFHILWLIFYLVLIAGIVIFVVKVYNEHLENQFPDGTVKLSTSKQKYQKGDTVSFTIENNFPTKIYVPNRCPQEPLDVYEWKDEKWLQIHDTAVDKNSECYKQSRRITFLPGQKINYSFKDWPNLFKEPGVYRLVMDIEHYQQRPFVDFIVLKPAKVIKNTTPTQPSQSTTQAPASSQTPAPAPTREREEEHEVEVEREQEVDD